MRAGQLILLLSFALTAGTVAGEERIEVSTRLLDATSSSSPKIGMPSLPLRFGSAKPKGMEIPGSDFPILWTRATLDGSPRTLGVGRPDEGKLVLFVDRNSDGDVSDDGEQVSIAGRGRSGRYAFRSKVELSDELYDFSVIPRGDSRMLGSITGTKYRQGSADVGDRKMVLVLLDQDLDGDFGTEGDRWWFGDESEVHKVKRLKKDNMIEAEEPVFIDNRAWMLDGLTEDGVVRIVENPEAGTHEEYLERRARKVNRVWFERFDREREAFIEAQKLDPTRKRVDSPPRFRHTLDLKSVLAQGRIENKPILLDFETDWCHWCKCLDYYTYPDAEVAAWLNRFVRVKWNADLDREEVFQRYGGGGFPALVILDADGKALHRVDGWKKPTELLVDLKQGFEAWRSGQGSPR